MKSSLQITKNIIATEGPLGLYKGLSAGVLRQLTYGTSRLGIFRTLTNHFTNNGQKKMDLPTTALCSVIAGSAGALIGKCFFTVIIGARKSSTKVNVIC